MDNINENTNKSGGPKTTAGKAISKYNAIRHGILVNVLLPKEHDEALIIQNKFNEEYRPQTLIEELLIETMVIAFMRQQRAFYTEIQDNIVNPVVHCETYLRYSTTSERQFYRALHELQRIQAIRSGIKPTSMAVDFIGVDKTD